MKINFTICFLLTGIYGMAQNGAISGSVSNEAKPLADATVAIAGINKGGTTDENGRYTITNLPAGAYHLVVTSVGYKTQKINVDVSSGVVIIQNFILQPDSGKLNEVIITGVSRATRIREIPQTVIAVSAIQIETSSENNTIDAISKNAPGLQTVKTGPNVSKPFINGLGYNRVLTLYDGLRVETQQWGDEHGVPIDDYIIEKAEVIEGPASLLYGSDAIAGVLSLFPAMPGKRDRKIHGRWLSEYQTNNGLIGNNLSLYYGNNHWDWAIRGSERIARNYTNQVDKRVYNTGFRMMNASAYLGYHTNSGYSHINATFYDNRQGIPDGSRDSLSRKFTYQIYESPGENSLLQKTDDIKNRPIVTNNILNSYAISPLSQRIQDYRLYNDNFYKSGSGSIKASLGFEQNIRREFDHPTTVDQAGEYIVLNTLNYGLIYNVPSFGNFSPAIGLNGIYQINTNKNATDFPIPNYHLFDLGGFGYLSWKHNKWSIAGGIRIDHRSENGGDLYIDHDSNTGFAYQAPASDGTAIHQFNAFHLSFQGVSGSLGGTYALTDKLSLKGNIARGYRSPNITEIASNGLDPGAHIYYIGNLNFKPEFSLQEDISLLGTLKDLQLGITFFNNYIQNYIYEDQKVDDQGNPVVIIPGNKTFQYQQTNARLRGLNATFNVRPENWKIFRFDNSLSLVYGNNLNPRYNKQSNQGEYLPFIPPPRWLSSIAYTIVTKSKTILPFTLKVENDLNLAQNRYLGLYNTETPTKGYDLIDFSATGNINYGKSHNFQWIMAVNNVFNTDYQNHLSRLQYFEYYIASPNGRTGIYNMGRNICFKIIVPF